MGGKRGQASSRVESRASSAPQYEKILATPAALKALQEEYNVSIEEVEKGKEMVWWAQDQRKIYAKAEPQIIEQVKKRHALFMKGGMEQGEREGLRRVILDHYSITHTH